MDDDQLSNIVDSNSIVHDRLFATSRQREQSTITEKKIVRQILDWLGMSAGSR